MIMMVVHHDHDGGLRECKVYFVRGSTALEKETHLDLSSCAEGRAGMFTLACHDCDVFFSPCGNPLRCCS